VYIKNLPPTINSDEDLTALFSEYGEITSAKLQVREGPDGTALYFGFCNFSEHEGAVRAIAGLNGSLLEDRTLECVRFKTRDERVRELQQRSDSWRQMNYEKYKGRNLYVRGFEDSTSEELLRGIFQAYGEIESLKIQRDDLGGSKKFAYLCFRNVEDAQRCLAGSALLRYPDSGKQVYVAEHIPANRKRQQNLQNKSSQARGADARQGIPPPIPGPQAAFMPREAHYAIPPQGFGPALGLPGLPPGLPAAFAPLSGEPLGGGAFFAQPNPRDRVRQEIMDQTPQNSDQQAQLLTRLKELSEDQLQRLPKDQQLLLQWMQQP
jgi:hypothetical protein